jgi:hypothetical protein
VVITSVSACFTQTRVAELHDSTYLLATATVLQAFEGVDAATWWYAIARAESQRLCAAHRAVMCALLAVKDRPTQDELRGIHAGNQSRGKNGVQQQKRASRSQAWPAHKPPIKLDAETPVCKIVNLLETP